MRSLLIILFVLGAASAIAGAGYAIGRSRGASTGVGRDTPQNRACPPPVPCFVSEPRVDWQAVVSERIETEVTHLHDRPALERFLEGLLQEAEQAGRLTPAQTSVGVAAIEALDKMSDQERSQMRQDFDRRLLELQTKLPPQPPLVHPPPVPIGRASDRGELPALD